MGTKSSRAGSGLSGSGLLLNRALLPMGARVAVAVSGGADSTALLLGLHEAATSLGIAVMAAHLHHGIRGEEADGDRMFVREMCARMGVRLVEAEADIPAEQARNGGTLEELSREARLAFFAGMLVSGEADVVATAHTVDDQAETVMMKLLRGAWTEGLGGITPVLEIDRKGRPVAAGGGAVGRVVRPLLGCSRAQVVAYLREREQAWREDSSNAMEVHTRNRVRLQLMPLLREFNPSIAATLSATADLAREEEARWAGEAARLYTQLAIPGRPVRGGGRSVGTGVEEETVAFEIERLRGLDMASRRRLLRLAASRMGVSLSAPETLRLLQLAGLAPVGSMPDPTVPSKPNSRLQMREGLRAERSVRELRLSRGGV